MARLIQKVIHWILGHELQCKYPSVLEQSPGDKSEETHCRCRRQQRIRRSVEDCRRKRLGKKDKKVFVDFPLFLCLIT